MVGILGRQEKSVTAVDQPHCAPDAGQMGEVGQPQAGCDVGPRRQLNWIALGRSSLQDVGHLSTLVVGRIGTYAVLCGVERAA